MADTLRRERDGEGFSGPVSTAYRILKNKHGVEIGLKPVGSRPMIGCLFQVGSLTGGLFSTRDWWRTTAVAEILVDREDYVRFRTENNSTYEWGDSKKFRHNAWHRKLWRSIKRWFGIKH